MSINKRFILLACVAGLTSLNSCTARYQDLLRDRDATIRELNGRLASLRGENENLAVRASTEQERAAELQARLEALASASPVEASTRGPLPDIPDVEVRYNRGRLSIGIANTVTFSSGATILKKSAGQVLKNVARVLLEEYPNNRIYIEGHTDKAPISKTKNKFEDNLHLSTERARAVRKYLIASCNFPENQVAIVGFGEFDPRESSSTLVSERDRRVEIVVGEAL